MSVRVRIGGKTAVLAGGRWRAADQLLQELLNDHMASLELPAHHPPADLERAAAQAAVRDLGAVVNGKQSAPEAGSRHTDSAVY
jgi:hypothetical protein